MSTSRCEYEHFVMSLTPAALDCIARLVDAELAVNNVLAPRLLVELSNVSTEIRARLQRVARGE